MKDFIIPLIAILALCGLEITALLMKINGVVLASVVAAIAGIAGYEINVLQNKRKNK